MAETMEGKQMANVRPLAFPIASQYSNQVTFDNPTVTLAAAALTQQTPIQIPAVGWLDRILLRFDVTVSGGTSPLVQADGLYRVLETIAFYNVSGVNLINSVNGFELYCMNKYGPQTYFGPTADLNAGIHKPPLPGATAATCTFFLVVPIGIDLAEATGSIPALADNSNYQLTYQLSSQQAITTSNPTVTVHVSGTSYFFNQPPALSNTPNPIPQEVRPYGAPDLFNKWTVERPSVSPGATTYYKQTKGGYVGTEIYIIRDSSGARVDGDWPGIMNLYINSQLRFRLSKAEHEFMMQRWYGYLAATKEAINGLDNGVFALPYGALLGAQNGDPNNTRAQYLPTIPGTEIKYEFNDFGGTANNLTILTQTVNTNQPGVLFSK